MTLPSATLQTQQDALLAWRDACHGLDRALQGLLPALPGAMGKVDESFGVALRALYSLETAFFPDRADSDDPAARKKERAKSLSARS